MTTPRNMPNPALALLAIFLLTLGLGVAAAFSGGTPTARAPEIQGTLLQQSKPVPGFKLTTGAGQPLTAADLAGQWTLMFFGYTHCPDVCPTTMAKLAATRQQLDDGALPAPLQVWFVSVDPARDTPEQLDQYIDSFDDGFLGATGEDAQLRKLTSALGISFRRHGDDPAGDYLVDHSAMLVLVDPKARVRAYFRPPHEPQRLARELEAVLRHAPARG